MMKQPQTQKSMSSRFKSIKAVSSFVLVGLVTFATIVVIAANQEFFSRIRQLEKKVYRFQDLSSQILHLDEVLTMSAKLAVSSQQSEWIERYKNHEPQLDQAILDLINEFPEIDLTQETHAANDELVKLEKLSFQLIQVGKKKEAEAVLNGETYLQYKLEYRLSLEKSLVQMKQNFLRQRESLMKTCLVLNSSIFILFCCSVLAWFAVVVRHRRRTSILTSDKARLEEAVELKEKQLIHKSKLASLGELSAGIAHEINNPLSIIFYALDLTEKTIDDPVKMRTYLEKLKRAARRISSIAKGIERFAYVGQNQDMEVIPLSSVVVETLDFLLPKVSQSRVELRTSIPQDLSIRCFRTQIEQVLINLINNSIDAIRNQPEPWIELNAEQHQDGILLRVIDSGRGVPHEIAGQIFNPFFTTKKVGEGTGLGLSIVRDIIEKHQGSVQVCHYGGHTCFELSFPCPRLDSQKTA